MNRLWSTLGHIDMQIWNVHKCRNTRSKCQFDCLPTTTRTFECWADLWANISNRAARVGVCVCVHICANTRPWAWEWGELCQFQSPGVRECGHTHFHQVSVLLIWKLIRSTPRREKEGEEAAARGALHSNSSYPRKRIHWLGCERAREKEGRNWARY